MLLHNFDGLEEVKRMMNANLSFANNNHAELRAQIWKNLVGFFVFILVPFLLITDCHAGGIKWKNYDLSEKGIYKGR